jgi:hypothetical protein
MNLDRYVLDDYTTLYKDEIIVHNIRGSTIHNRRDFGKEKRKGHLALFKGSALDWLSTEQQAHR